MRAGQALSILEQATPRLVLLLPQSFYRTLHHISHSVLYCTVQYTVLAKVTVAGSHSWLICCTCPVFCHEARKGVALWPTWLSVVGRLRPSTKSEGLDRGHSIWQPIHTYACTAAGQGTRTLARAPRLSLCRSAKHRSHTLVPHAAKLVKRVYVARAGRVRVDIQGRRVRGILTLYEQNIINLLRDRYDLLQTRRRRRSPQSARSNIAAAAVAREQRYALSQWCAVQHRQPRRRQAARPRRRRR